MTVERGRKQRRPGIRQDGFSMMELAVALAIFVIVVAIAIPMMRPAVQKYQLRSAASSVSGTIQAVRYRAISDGYPYQLILKAATNTYQVQNNPNFLTGGAYANTGGAVPFAGSTPVVLSADTTFQFRPSGTVSAPVGAMTFTLTYAGNTETITVSTYGDVKVTP